jgi:hypothetical protein
MGCKPKKLQMKKQNTKIKKAAPCTTRVKPPDACGDDVGEAIARLKR